MEQGGEFGAVGSAEFGAGVVEGFRRCGSRRPAAGRFGGLTTCRRHVLGRVRGSGAVMAASAGVRVPSQAAASRWAWVVAAWAEPHRSWRVNAASASAARSRVPICSSWTEAACSSAPSSVARAAACTAAAHRRNSPCRRPLRSVAPVRARPADRRTPGRSSNPGWPTTAIAS